MKIQNLLACLFCCLILSCSKKDRPATPFCYYWRTQFSLNQEYSAWLDSLDCQNIYVKYLDIGIDPNELSIRPLSRLEVMDTSGLNGKTIHPCVFILNEVFRQTQGAQIESLAEKTITVLQAIDQQWRAPALTRPGTIVQIDCDWTASTQSAYFSFLKKLKQQLPPQVQLSATIRLHQYKFPEKTGVPAVDRGMLMLYNSGDIDDPYSDHSIYDANETQKYLKGAPRNYPLPLDIALPIFNWALIYRQDELWKIIPDPSPTDLNDTSRFRPIPLPAGKQSKQYTINKGTYLSGHYLRPGDQLRWEQIQASQLHELAQFARDINLAVPGQVAFYHLDQHTREQYSPLFLKTIWQECIKK